MLHHRIENRQELLHAGHECDVGDLAVAMQPQTKIPNHRIVQGGHISGRRESGSDHPRPAASRAASRCHS